MLIYAWNLWEFFTERWKREWSSRHVDLNVPVQPLEPGEGTSLASLLFLITLEIQVEIKSNWTTKSWRNFFRSTPPKLDRCFLSFSFSVWHNSDITFIQPAVAVSVWLMDFTLTCVQAGQLAQRANPWVGEISQLSVISWLVEDLKLQVLLLSYRADEDKALLPVSW